MCRLFALHGGREPLRASFWLLDAPDSLAAQSHRNPDGFGIGTFETDGSVDIDRGACPAFSDELFLTEAREECSTTYLAHVRYASQGPVEERNSHPFTMDGRLFAHNGHIEDLPEDPELVAGETDSERLFALITRAARANGGDVEAAVVATLRRVAAEARVFAANVILTTPTDIWAVRYPEPNELWLLERRPGVLDDVTSERTHVRSTQLAERPSVVIASERMDDDPGWTLLAPGEMVHVDADLVVRRKLVLPDPPARPLTLADLDARAAASQRDA
jgi:predicted glutamine amidotransferase